MGRLEEKGGRRFPTDVPVGALAMKLVSISDLVKPNDHRRWLHLSKAVAVLDDPESSAKREKQRTRPARFLQLISIFLDTQSGLLDAPTTLGSFKREVMYV